jgi:hypothetical protein
MVGQLGINLSTFFLTIPLPPLRHVPSPRANPTERLLLHPPRRAGPRPRFPRAHPPSLHDGPNSGCPQLESGHRDQNVAFGWAGWPEEETVELEPQVTTSDDVRCRKIRRAICPVDGDLLGAAWPGYTSKASRRSGDGSWAGRRRSRLFPLLQDDPPRVPVQLGQQDDLDLVVRCGEPPLHVSPQARQGGRFARFYDQRRPGLLSIPLRPRATAGVGLPGVPAPTTAWMTLFTKESCGPIIVPSILQTHGDNSIPHFLINGGVKSSVRPPRYDNDEDLLLSIVPPEPDAPAAGEVIVECGVGVPGNT